MTLIVFALYKVRPRLDRVRLHGNQINQIALGKIWPMAKPPPLRHGTCLMLVVLFSGCSVGLAQWGG